MRIDCHVHTAARSACSSLDPRRACELAVLRGLDLVVFTEHHAVWSEAELAPLRREFPELTLFSGMEATLAEGFDVVVLAELDPADLPPYRTGIGELARAVEPLGDAAFLFVAHPFRYTGAVDPELARVLSLVQGIEMSSVNILRGGCVRESGRYRPELAGLYAAARERCGLVPLWNSDAHREGSVGALCTLLDLAGPPRSIGELARALRGASPRESQAPELLGRALAGYGC